MLRQGLVFLTYLAAQDGFVSGQQAPDIDELNKQMKDDPEMAGVTFDQEPEDRPDDDMDVTIINPEDIDVQEEEQLPQGFKPYTEEPDPESMPEDPLEFFDHSMMKLSMNTEDYIIALIDKDTQNDEFMKPFREAA